MINAADNLLLLLTVFLVLGGGIYANNKRRTRKVETAGESVLMGYYTEGVPLFPLSTGVVGDMPYTVIATLPGSVEGSGDQAGLLCRVELPFHSQVHLLGIPKKNGAVQLNPAGGKSLMEQVSLEGDYDKYFALYAEKNMQQQSRYVLDPKAMVFTVDFCQSHNWEILDSELYFVQATSDAPDDPTSMFDDIVTFVKEIEPAISQPLTEHEIMLRTPYNEERRENLVCPLCSEKLVNNRTYLACPNNEGYLLKGSVLSQIHHGIGTLPFVQPAEPKNHDRQLICPACGNKMARSPYNGGKTIIDTCTNCPYRWLDMGELTNFTPLEQ